jgi:hypothetical protein
MASHPNRRAVTPKLSIALPTASLSGDDGGGLVSEHVVSELPCDSDDGKIATWAAIPFGARQPICFRSARLLLSKSPRRRPRHYHAALPSPKTCPGAMRYLDDRQLDLLLQATIDEF